VLQLPGSWLLLPHPLRHDEIYPRVRFPALVSPPASILISGSGKLAAIGAAVALLGCFLPLANGVGENTAVLPGLISHVGEAFLIPLSAITLGIFAGLANADYHEKRVLLGGGIIALASPWSVLCLAFIFIANRIASSMPFSSGQNFGPGIFVLALGFTLALVGGFLVLHNTTKK